MSLQEKRGVFEGFFVLHVGRFSKNYIGGPTSCDVTGREERGVRGMVTFGDKREWFKMVQNLVT